MDQPAAESRPMTMAEGVDALDALLGGSDTGPEPEEVTKETQPEEPEEITEEAESDEEEAEDEGFNESEDEDSDEDEPEEDSEEPQIESLSDLAEALEIPVEELQANLKTKIKVQGEELEVTLAELAQGYQKDADYRKKTTELSENRRQFEAAYGMANDRLNREFQQLGQLLNTVKSMAVPQVDPAELEYLKQTDPSAYLIRKNELEEAQGRFNHITQAAQQAYAQHAEQLQAMQQQAQQAAIERAREELPHRVPDFGPKVKEALDSYLTSEHYGYTPEELAQITDPRLIELVHKAHLWDSKGKDVEVTTKKVKKLPKVQSPKGAGVKPKSTRIDKAKARLKGSGSLDDAASAIANLL